MEQSKPEEIKLKADQGRLFYLRNFLVTIGHNDRSTVAKVTITFDPNLIEERHIERIGEHAVNDIANLIGAAVLIIGEDQS